MSFGTFHYPMPANEPVQQYAPGSKEREAQQRVLAELKKKELDIPQYIGGRAVRSGDKHPIHPPHERNHVLGYYHAGNRNHVQQAIDAALKAKPMWEAMPWEERAAIFLKAADLIATKYRYHMNGTTMLGQSKNVYQAEIDSACEIIDFLR
ncbi:MAG: aldehyde dehydrogenase family protein, partial [Chitinophagaceae bacterium]|nr:aldehyde dehydrogenase family protein [Chitinophagaceae bacterium]